MSKRCKKEASFDYDGKNYCKGCYVMLKSNDHIAKKKMLEKEK